ncbi:hypothetical protein GGR57DRAFT_520239 [Xylariaceae sp. FL1272]|nr:hypothetical protein GGR57DRAFT_520239 [Xylariaceae sp. FL1272]
MTPKLKSAVLSLILGLSLLQSTTATGCAIFDITGTYRDDGTSFSTSHSILLETKQCPRDATENCAFEQKTYDITAQRELSNGSSIDLLYLPQDEVEAIFDLVGDALTEDWYPNQNHTKVNFSTISTTVDSHIFESDSTFLEIEPNQNKTLHWTGYYISAWGTLSNCTNTTLNNLTVTASTPYYTQQAKYNNRTMLAGQISASWTNITDESGAMSLMDRAVSSAMYASVLGTAVFAFLL